MWNFSERTVQVRTFLIILGGTLILAALIFVLILNHFGTSVTAPVPTQNTLSPQVVDTSAFVPVDNIDELIKPCLFVFLNSCAQPAQVSLAVDPSPSTDPNQNTGAEQLAINDIFSAIGNSPNKGLATYQVPISDQQVAQLFPEYEQDASSSAVNLPAPLVIARVGAKYNINQRVLLAMMEILNKGAGPLLSSTSDFTTPYFSTNPGFLNQLLTVAQGIQASKAKYDVLLHDQQKLPTSVTFFAKSYGVKPTANEESLALADFLSNNLDNKKDFELAIYSPVAQDNSGINKSQNFIFLYQLIFGTDPR